jgi:hypothetical protein
MSVTEFFRYLLGHEPSTVLAVQVLEVRHGRARADASPPESRGGHAYATS